MLLILNQPMIFSIFCFQLIDNMTVDNCPSSSICYDRESNIDSHFILFIFFIFKAGFDVLNEIQTKIYIYIAYNCASCLSCLYINYCNTNIMLLLLVRTSILYMYMYYPILFYLVFKQGMIQVMNIMPIAILETRDQKKILCIFCLIIFFYLYWMFRFFIRQTFYFLHLHV